jgi:hypothetical protein
MIPDHFFEGEELSPEAAAARLLANCDDHQPQTYYRPLQPDELAARKDLMAELDIEHGDLAEAKKLAMADFKGKMDPLALRKKNTLTEVRTKQVKETGEVYTILFPTDRKAATYDHTGRLLSTRSMTPEERQSRIDFEGGHMRASRTGTDG